MFVICGEGYQERARLLVKTWSEFYVCDGSRHGDPRPTEAVVATV